MTAGPSTTQLLHDAREGDRDALDRLFPRLYDELRQLAHAKLRRHRPSETLNTTALVHEVYIKLTTGENPSFTDRVHFFALAARAMRFVLIGYAREQAAQKRGGGQPHLTFNEALGTTPTHADAEAVNLLALDDALNQLARLSERLAEVVELRFFGGMQHEEIAEHTGRSLATVKRDWRRARAWLYHTMRERPADASPDDRSGTDDTSDAETANGG